ncbi:hypothetical protein [Hymenobacter radiodurans]|nr:hypothetical protein [Hymenobacter radiodurans]
MSISMVSPLAELLAQLRVGNQRSLITFYEQNRDHFARWAKWHYKQEPTTAHATLRAVLLEFYDRATDGRLTKMPPDLRAFIYDMARERLDNAAAERLPQAEANRRQHLLQAFHALGADCRQVLSYFYFRGYNFEKVAGKMGYPNAVVARIQKSTYLRKLYEVALQTSDADHQILPPTDT